MLKDIAAIRELFEETGIIVGIKEKWAGKIPTEWKQFADLGLSLIHISEPTRPY